jgi:hypothetical protein
VVAGLIAAVKLARVESIELQTGVLECDLLSRTQLRLHACHRGQQSEMNWRQAKAQARRLVEEAVASL